jgi:transposase
MPELGSLEKKQAASLAGLAPMMRPDAPSDRRTGQRPARPLHARSRGRPFQTELKSQIRAAHQRRKAKFAIAAIMRKIVVLADALLKDTGAGPPNPPDEGGYFCASTVFPPVLPLRFHNTG